MPIIRADNALAYQAENGETLGKITWRTIDAHTIDANHTYVAPALRGQGIARRRLAHPRELSVCGQNVCPQQPLRRGQNGISLAQNFIAAFAFVILAFQRLDAGVLLLLGYSSGVLCVLMLAVPDA